MSDSDNDRPPAAQTAKQRERDRRRAALARLKDASQSRRQPRFLGADKDSADGDGDAQDDEPVDFERWARESARRRGKNPNSDDRAAANDSSRRRSASPLRDPTLSRAFDDLFDLGGAGEGGAKTGGEAGEGEVAPDLDDDEAPAKKRRIVAKLDEDRLLGPNGFPLLRQHMQKFKPKGKGHERQDLKGVLTMYQLWSHQMYPKTNLRDTLQTVEKLCRKRTVQRALKQYRDEAKHGNRDDDERNEVDAFAGLPLSSARDERSQSAADTSRKHAAEPSREDMLRNAGFDLDGGANEEDDLYADEEAILAELEAESRPQATAQPPSQAPEFAARPDQVTASAPAAAQEDELDDEAEAALREAEALLM